MDNIEKLKKRIIKLDRPLTFGTYDTVDQLLLDASLESLLSASDDELNQLIDGNLDGYYYCLDY